MNTRFYKFRRKVAIVGLVNVLILGFLFVATSFVFPVIPNCQDILKPVDGRYVIHYGFDYFTVIGGNIANAFTFATSIPTSIALYLLIVCFLLCLVFPFAKSRTVMFIYLVPVGLSLLFSYMTIDFFFNNFLSYEGNKVDYFNILLLNQSMHFVVVVYYWIVMFFLVQTLFCTIALTVTIVAVNTKVGKNKIDKYQQKLYERSYPTVRETREISRAEFLKYIKAHREEVLEILGLTSRSEVVKPAPEVKPEVKEEPRVISSEVVEPKRSENEINKIREEVEEIQEEAQAMDYDTIVDPNKNNID